MKRIEIVSGTFVVSTFAKIQNFLGAGLIFALIILSACTPSQGVTFITNNGNVHISTEIADTNQERSQGLMNRTELGKNSGMLFVFDEEAQRTFWMKNTLIPLDMIFIGADLIIDEVKSDVQPCVTEQCHVYQSIQPAQYVVEVNAGFAKEHSIEKGQKIVIN